MTPLIEHLKGEHEEVRRLLARALAGEALDEAAFEEARARLLRHIAVEEKVIMPAVARASGARHPLWRRLRVEHGAITSLLVPTPDCALVGELCALLSRHDAWEEGPGGLYEEVEAALGETWPDVLAQARAYGPVKVARHVDRPGMPRTAAEALRRAERMRPGEPPASDEPDP